MDAPLKEDMQDEVDLLVINHGVSGEGSANPGQVRRLIFEI